MQLMQHQNLHTIHTTHSKGLLPQYPTVCESSPVLLHTERCRHGINNNIITWV